MSITTVENVKKTLGLTDTFISDGDGSIVVGQSYKITSNTTGDFTNIGAPDNLVDTVFVATGSTPTLWGDGVLLLYTTDLEISELIKELTIWIVEYTFNDFTKIRQTTSYGGSCLVTNDYTSTTLSFTANEITEASGSGLDFLLFDDIKIVGLSRNQGYFTVTNISGPSLTIEEDMEVESNGQSITLFGVYWPADLARALSYMIGDVLDGNDKEVSNQSETIGNYSYSKGGKASDYNITNFNDSSVNTINKYRMVRSL